MRLSLRLILTFVGVISITAALVMLLANRIIDIQFNNLVINSGVVYARRMAPVLARYYERHNNSWQGIDSAVSKLQENLQTTENLFPGGGQLVDTILREDRLILLDNSGKLVLDTKPDEALPTLTANLIRNGIPVTANKQRLGTLVTSSSIGALTPSQKTFLTQINLWMLIAAGLIILAVSVASVFVANSILAPVRSLARAAHQVAAGDYTQKLPVENSDELADMALSFNRMVSQLEEQHELRRRAMADVAHELRTPLSVLQVELEGMEDGLTPATPETLRALQTEVAHLNHLVEDLRMLSLVEAHEFSLDLTPLDMQGLILDVVERLGESANTKGITLRADIRDAHLLVKGDSQRLAQVMINLVSNAFQHTPSAGSIVIGARQAQNWVQVWVHDTGAGIPAADLPHIFERFYRSDKARSRAKGGSGLGLAIAKSLVEAHGGKIWAESVEGQGANLIFVLPLRADAAPI
jgi:signal transduction histidine kinase